MSPFWSAYITIISLLCMAWISYGLYFVLFRMKPKLEEDGTTGHVYDGIKEYDKPMPTWWIISFVASIIFGCIYFVLYPALGNFKGVATIKMADNKIVPWTSANEVTQHLAENNAKFLANYNQKFAGKSIEVLADNKDAHKVGQRLFLQNCAVCHGSTAKGTPGFPNLTDADWIYGGTPEIIHETIAKGRIAGMPIWGEKLGEDGVKATAEYVMSLSDQPNLNKDLVVQGKVLFDANCTLCHGKDAKGMQTAGAPNLTDDIWLYGGDRKTIRTTIRNGRAGVMPMWGETLGEERVKLLSAYVYSLSTK